MYIYIFFCPIRSSLAIARHLHTRLFLANVAFLVNVGSMGIFFLCFGLKSLRNEYLAALRQMPSLM